MTLKPFLISSKNRPALLVQLPCPEGMWENPDKSAIDAVLEAHDITPNNLVSCKCMCHNCEGAMMVDLSSMFGFFMETVGDYDLKKIREHVLSLDDKDIAPAARQLYLSLIDVSIEISPAIVKFVESTEELRAGL